jgi:acyl carrier protein
MISTLTQQDLLNLVIPWIQEHKLANDLERVEITAETDVLRSALLDSFGLVDLMVFIESIIGCNLDITDADPDDFSAVGGLCRIALRSQSNVQLR